MNMVEKMDRTNDDNWIRNEIRIKYGCIEDEMWIEKCGSKTKCGSEIA